MGQGQKMIKAIFALVVAVFAGAVVMMPAPEPPQPGPAVAVDPPSVSVCPVDEGSGRSTTVGVVATVAGPGLFTAFAGGAPAGSAPFETGASGVAAIPLQEVAPIGVAAGLVELPGDEAASASLMVGSESVAHESCLTVPAPQTLLGAGSTTTGEEYDIQLMNPYSGGAVVDLTVVSESGIESASQLRGIAVPSRSSAVVDMDQILPGRASLAVTIEASTGSVMAVGRLTAGADSALWDAVAPALDWFIPVPSGAGSQVVVSSGVASDVEYQVDLYGGEGLLEAFQTGVVPAHGFAVVDPGSAAGPTAVRIISTQPVSVFLRNVGASGASLTAGSTVAAAQWLLPAAGMAPGATGRMVILNAGLDEATVTVTAISDAPVAQEVSVPAGTVVEFPAIEGGAHAYTLNGEGLLVPLWVTTTETASAYSTGVPLVDE
jgi:hypothetical protein